MTAGFIEALFNTIRSKMDTLTIAAKVQYDNAPIIDVDADGGQTPEDKDPWIRFSIKPGTAEQVSRGDTKRFRYPGICVAQIFVPIDAGDQAGLALADVVNTEFLAVTANGVTWQTPYLSVVGKGNSKRWWQINVICPFYSDTIV